MALFFCALGLAGGQVEGRGGSLDGLGGAVGASGQGVLNEADEVGDVLGCEGSGE